MLIVLSPAKTLDFTPTSRPLSATKPEFHSEAKKLAAIVKRLSKVQLAELMDLSDKLAEQTHGYFATWKATWDARAAKQAALAFRGDVYQGLEADTLGDRQLEAAQSRLRVLSGLYGVLRPLDLIQPYRLEMGRALANERGDNLYAWWGDRVTKALNRALDELPPDAPRLVVNLASNEYWSVVRPEKLGAQVVTPVFKDRSAAGYKVLSFFAKRARGEMARHLLGAGPTGIEAIDRFAASGYRRNASLSTPASPVFTREKPPARS
ncbi:MAG: peroxide stress protein YaaA [Lacipirellulaceae bacterium]